MALTYINKKWRAREVAQVLEHLLPRKPTAQEEEEEEAQTQQTTIKRKQTNHQH
jgi:hypothetical protein